MKISVYITSYNQKIYLEEAIKSVLNQNLMPFEIIIVDDNSTDGSQELIKYYANKYSIIKYFFHKENLGVSQVRITALSNVTCDFVTYLDGDDLYLPNKLQIESNLIKQNDSDLAFTNNMYVDPDNINNIRWIWTNDKIDMKGNLFAKTLTRDFPRKSLFRMELVRYSLLKQVGFHDLNLKIYEDYDLRIRLAQKVNMSYSLEPTTKIRISKNGLSKIDISEHMRAYKYIYKKYDSDIENLDKNLKKEIRLKLQKNLDLLKSKSQTNYKKKFKNKFKNKLKYIIDRI